MAKKKTVLERAAEAVDHVLHPDHKAQPESNLPAEVPVESSPAKSAYENHPKFDKFKNKGGE